MSWKPSRFSPRAGWWSWSVPIRSFRNSAQLEKYLATPASTGVLVLDVKNWPANTRLAKLLEGDAALVCKAPAAHRLPGLVHAVGSQFSWQTTLG